MDVHVRVVVLLVGVLSLVASTVSAQEAPGEPGSPGQPGVAFPEPLVSQLPGPRGDGDRFEMLDQGHLDGDGHIDLAVLRHDSTSGSHHTSVVALLGTGDGTFTSTSERDITTAARNIDGGVVIDQLTGEPHADLASATDDIAEILIHPGLGDGTFGPTAAISLTAPDGAAKAGPHLLRSADLDDDGDVDLVAGFSNGVSILRSDGVGGFAAPTVHGTDVGTLQDVVVADLDADGRTDLAMAGTDALQVLVQTAGGGFQQGARLENELNFGNGFTAAVAGDFTGDGDLDVVVGRDGDAGFTDAAGIFAGGGDGTLTSPATWEDTPSRFGVARNSNDHLADDLDGDGHVDALFAARATAVAVFGDGAGGLDTHAWLVSTPDADLGDSVTGTQSTTNALAGDLDGDGRLDLIAGADGGIFASVNVLLADPDRPRRWSAAQVFKATTHYDDYFSVALAEFTGDTHPDILTVGRGDGLQVSAGRGDGTFADAVVVAGDDGGCYWGYLDRTGDLDGDGHADFVCHAEAPFVYFGDGLGGVEGMQLIDLTGGSDDSFQQVAIPDGFHLTSDVLPVDLDGVEGDELVVSSTRRNRNAEDTAWVDTTQITVLRYAATSDAMEVLDHVDIGSPEATNKDSTYGLVAGDFDDDGDVDLSTWFTPTNSATGANPAERVVIPGDGTGGLGDPVRLATGLPHEHDVASRVGDLDNDGNPDIVSVTSTPDGRALVVEQGVGDGTFTTPVAYPTREDGDGQTGMALVDVDVDGDLDVAVEIGRSIEIHLGDGTGGVAPPTHLQKGDFGGTSLAVDELDGDGRPDIVFDAANGAAVHLSAGDVVAPTMNLTVEQVTGPTSPVRAGDDATIGVTVRNTGTVVATGPWVDEVTLDTDRGPVVIGSSLRQAPLAPGDAYTATITGSWPATTAGAHDLIAATDARAAVDEADEDDNAATTSITSTVDEVPYDLDVVGTVGADRVRLHRIQVDGEAAALTVTAPDGVRFATALGSVPAQDQLVAVGDERVLRTGEHFLLIAGTEEGDVAEYQLQVTRVESGVQSVSPSQLRRGPSTFEIRGAAFAADTTVTLRRDEGAIPASTVQRVSSTLLLVSVDLTSAALGNHDLVVHSDGVDHVVADGITVIDAAPARFEVFVSVPETARLFRTSPVQVTILNAGGVDALAPVVRVSSDRARLGRHDDGRFDTRSIDFLAVADDGSRVLAAGESAHVNARFDPDPGVEPGDDMGFTARAYGVGNTTPWSWTGAQDRLRPDGLPDAVWAQAFDTFGATVGGTAGSYALALHDVHADLAELGLATDRGDRMIPRVVARVVAGVPAAELAGTVRDADGPLVERDVLLVDQAGGITQVTSTIDGGYAAHGVAPGTYDIHVRDAVPTPAAVVELPRDEPLDLTVSAPVSLTGRVLYPDGRGAGRVPVVVEQVGQEGTGVGTAQTDASGGFTVPDLSLGQLRVVATAPDHAPAVTLVDAAAPGRVEVADLSLGAGLPVSGTITAGDGTPLAGARVIVRSGDGRASSTATSQAGGSYEARGLPSGAVLVTAVHPTAGQGSVSATLTDPGATVDVTLEPGGALMGTVTSSTGGPIAGAVVLSDALRGDDVRTVADGSFRIDGVPAGDSRIEVRAPGHVPTRLTVTVDAGGDTDIGPVELPTLGTLPVTVTGADDAPLAGVPVTATLIGGLGGTVRTGAGGAATLRDLVPGRYVIHAGTTTGPDSTRAVVDVVSGTNAPISLGADLTTVRGSVRTATGIPVAGAEVAAIVDGEPLLLATTDAGGAFALLTEPGTDIHLRALTRTGHVAVVRDLHVGDGDLVQDLTLGASALDVQAQGSGPVAGAELVLRLDDVGEVARTRTDDSGTARFDGLPGAGGWTILAAGDGSSPRLVSGTLTSGTTAVPVTLAAGRSITGRLVDGDGAAVPGGLVGALDPGTGEPVLTASDADGEWTLRSLSPGTVDVFAADGVDVGELVDVDLSAGSATDVVITLDGRGTTVQGLVTDLAGTPLIGRVVQLTRDGLPIAQTTTGADGRYGIDGVPAGDWTLVLALGGPSVEQAITVPDQPDPVVEDLVALPTIGWILQPPFVLAPPGNVTTFNASVTPDATFAAVPTIRRASLPDGAGSVTFAQTDGGFTVSGLPRPQENAWAAQNETAWRANQGRTNPLDSDCPPTVYSLERALIESEIAMDQAFYDLQTSYGSVQQVYTAGMGQALAEGVYTGLKTWVTVSGMAQGPGAQSVAADALAGIGLPVIDTTAGVVGEELFLGGGTLSGGDVGSTVLGVNGGLAGLAGQNGVSNGLGALGVAQDWKKFHDSLGEINESQLNTLISYSLTEDRYLAAVQRHQQLTNSYAVATVECDPDPPEEEPDDEDGPDDDEDGGGGGGGGGGDDEPPTPPEGPSDDPRNPDGPGPDGSGEATSTGGESADPNEIVGPSGVGDAGWIAAPADLGYQISYENMPQASLAATIVTVTTQLDPDTDWSTFELGDLGWGPILVDVPAGLQQWSGRVPLPQVDDVVDVVAGLDAGTGEVTWTMTTIDPTTGQITDGDGYLPPNDVAKCGLPHCGEGFVDYSVEPASTDTGTEISAQAEIVFDENAPIVTNTWVNTIDTDRPVAAVTALPAQSTGAALDLAWTATDGGSGAVTYDLFAQVDGSALFPYAEDLATTSARVPVETGSTYGFAVLATDAVGQQEDVLGGAEATTLVVAGSGGDDDAAGGGSGGGGVVGGGGEGGSVPPSPEPSDPGSPPDEGPTEPEPPVDQPPAEPEPPAEHELQRIEGGSRIETSIALSQQTYPTLTPPTTGLTGKDRSMSATAAKVAVLARADAYADALAGGPLASALTGPILLTASDALSAPTAAELQRLGIDHVVLLGGGGALSDQVAADVGALGVRTVERVEGPNRFATAAAVAARLGPLDAAYLALGGAADPTRGWPDAVAVSALAAHQRRPILLVEGNRLPAETTGALDGLASATIVGGTAVIGSALAAEVGEMVPDVDRLAGGDRYATSSAIAARHAAAGGDPDDTWLVTGADWPDALAAGPAVAASGGVLHLVDGGSLDASTRSWLESHRPGTVTLVGGPSAISQAVATQIGGIIE